MLLHPRYAIHAALVLLVAGCQSAADREFAAAERELAAAKRDAEWWRAESLRLGRELVELLAAESPDTVPG